MKAILIDRNNTEAFVGLEDGTVITLPLSQVEQIHIGDNIHFSKSTTNLNTNTSFNPIAINNNFVDFL